MNVVCMFEQSGIFRDEFIKLGHNCVDIDIQNSFNQTDFVRDIFADIENDCLYYLKYNKVDLVVAFSLALGSVITINQFGRERGVTLNHGLNTKNTNTLKIDIDNILERVNWLES